jgi:hypothetical protein
MFIYEMHLVVLQETGSAAIFPVSCLAFVLNSLANSLNSEF